MTKPFLNIINIPIPGGDPILRLETFRAKRKWWEVYKPKYTVRCYALTKSAIFDITEYLEAATEAGHD